MIKKFKVQSSKFKVKLGFTLIELLVVISIIGILVAFLTSSYSQAQKQGRDAKRKGDMKSFQTAFEQYKVTLGVYPTSVGVGSSAAAYFSGGVPSDPRGGVDFGYSKTLNTTDYCVCARLEVTGKGNSINDSCNFDDVGSKDYACVKNLQ